MRVRVTITADQMAMSVKTAEERDRWVKWYRNDIQSVWKNSEWYVTVMDNAIAKGDHETAEWAKRMICSLRKPLQHKQNMIDKLNAMAF